MLKPNRDQITRFVRALFRHADPWSYASVRWFPDDKSGRPWKSTLWRFYKPDDRLIDAAINGIRLCANASIPIVFCPPIATFIEVGRATDSNLCNGLTLSVECDENPTAARATLTGLLGPPTIVVASGGIWEEQDKLHCHWRLKVATRTAEDHSRLKLARRRAMKMINGDITGTPVSHAYRWPGSWHRKDYDNPRLVKIVEENDTNIELDDALARLPEDDEPALFEAVGQRRETIVLTAYGETLLRAAAKAILGAPNGRQEYTLNAQAFSIGRAAGSGVVPVTLALDILLTAAGSIKDYDMRRPWRPGQAQAKVRGAFAEGLAKPRAALADVVAEFDRLAGEADGR